jgi:hypothetical protein
MSIISATPGLRLYVRRRAVLRLRLRVAVVRDRFTNCPFLFRVRVRAIFLFPFLPRLGGLMRNASIFVSYATILS